MDIIRFSIRNPVTVIVGVILVCLFGFVSVRSIPIQLSPNVEEPEITVHTVWPGATPYEIERDIIEEQEKVLKGIPGLYEMESTSRNSSGQVTLRFKIGADLESALLRVANKLDEVPSYPETVDKPVINASGGERSPVMWMMLRTEEGNERDIYTYRTYFENNVRQYLDRIDGVAELFIGGGVEQEMHVRVDPERLAAYGLTIDQVVTALRAANANVSAGNLDVGRREYRVRSVAEFRSVDDIEEVVVVADGERKVLVRDLAKVDFGYERFSTPVLSGRGWGMAVGVRPEPNTNVLDLTDRVEAAAETLNKDLLRDAGLYLEIVNEQRPYIRGALRLLRNNIALGGALAVVVLLLFLRHLAPTIVVSTAIPISIVGTFAVMFAAGSSLNVVSLAGIAFAIGMLVDNAIVVLENIDRHLHMDKGPARAAYDGTREVWGAVLASSLTTIAVFLPVVFLQDEAGQLFRDIAIAVSSAVLISLIVSVTVIPMFSKQLFAFAARKGNGGRRITFADRLIQPVGNGLSRAIMALVALTLHNAATRLITIVLLSGGAFFTAYALLPKMEYLPQGNRDLIMNIIIPPPGLSYAERLQIGENLFAHLDPYSEPGYEGYPGIKHRFYVGRSSSMFFGVISADQARTRELIPLCREAIGRIPGVYGVTSQASIFASSIGGGRSIEVNLSGNSIDQLVNTAGVLFGMIPEAIPDTQVRPRPSLELLYPEAQFVPDRDRLRSVGMTAQQFGLAVDVLMDGRDIGDFKQEGEKKIELVVKAGTDEIDTPEALHNALIVTPGGEAVPVSSLAELERTSGLTEIRHLERDRTISLRITPPIEVPIQEAMEIIEGDLIPSLRDRGLMEGIRFTMSGTADKLVETRQALSWNFVIAIIISYLLMSALLSNFVYPGIILFTVPLAGAGGFIGLRLVNQFIALQQLDILTMLGFIILIGVVVNNAILIVYQALRNVRYDAMDYKPAVIESVRTRLRPIYMSAMTSLFGMMPLVLWPGPGSELYRGLGSVVLGGLALSTLFTVFLIPALLLFFIPMERPGSALEADAEMSEIGQRRTAE